MNAIEQATKELSRLPGYRAQDGAPARVPSAQVGGRQGSSSSPAALTSELRQRVRPCERCGNYSEEALCPTSARVHGVTEETVCVVEEAYEVGAIERTGRFPGVYHVLGGRLSPLDGDRARGSSGYRRFSSGPAREVRSAR